MALTRTKSISTKVTVEEYDALKRRAGTRSISEWARTVLLKADADGADAALLAELWAFRYVLTNALPALTCEADRPALIASITAFIQEADQKKAAKAKAILETAR
jgi:hypothetical protein